MVRHIPLTVVIVRWKNGEELRRCIGSVSAEYPEDIILVDSGSNDGGGKKLAEKYPQIRLLEFGENIGFAAAVNRGVSCGGAPFLAILNPDIVVSPGSLSRISSLLEQGNPSEGIVPQLLFSSGGSQFRWQLRRLPRLTDLCMGKPGKPAFRRLPSSTVGIEQPAAAAWFFPRETWEKTGGFDESFSPAWWEDVDFCKRMKEKRTGVFRFHPEITLRHEGASSLNRLPRKEFLAVYYRNLLHYAHRHHRRHIRLIRAAIRIKLLTFGATDRRLGGLWKIVTRNKP